MRCLKGRRVSCIYQPEQKSHFRHTASMVGASGFASRRLLVSNLLCSRFELRSGPNILSLFLSIVSMTACIFLRRPRGSTAKLSIPERISASGDKGTGRCSAFRGRTLDAAQKINLVKLDPRTNCLLPRRLRGILSFRCGDRIGIGSRDDPLS